MAANSRFAVAVHIAAVLASSPGSWWTSARIAKSVNTNPVVIRRITCALAEAGICECRCGKLGGARLIRKPESVTLLEIYQAIGAPPLFAQNQRPANKNCAVSCAMKSCLTDVFGQVDLAVKDTLGTLTLAKVVPSRAGRETSAP